MTRQNRVLPDGQIVATAARGMLMGNRGVLHDASGQLGPARWRHQAWVCCRLQFKDRKRAVMQPGRYTELFFLDEAVALAAGHRPCAECRRPDYLMFSNYFSSIFMQDMKAWQIDRRLHAARIEPGSRRQRRHQGAMSDLPDGTFVCHQGAACLVLGRALYPFFSEGYGPALPRPTDGLACVLTPAPTVAVLRRGFRPALHPSVA